MDKALDEAGFQMELEESPLDEDSWGLSPAAVEGQERALRMSGGGQAGG